MKRNNIYNKNKRNILSLILALSIIIVCSCEDVLEKVPTDSYSDAAVWNDAALTEAFINYAYKTIPFGFQQGWGWRFLPFANMSDECNSRNSATNIQIIILGNASPSYSGPMDVWSGPGWCYWEPISQANKFLDKIGNSTIKQTSKDRFIAEMRVVRAYSYFKFLCHYGGVPLVKEPFGLEDDFKIPRDSYEDIMQFILQELDESIDALPLEYDAGNTGRVTRGAAMAIKSRALLFYASPLNNPSNDMTRWQKAADAAKAIIDLGIYELHPDYKELFTEAGGYNTKEIIWGRPQNDDIDQESRVERLLYPNGWLGFAHPHPLQNLVDDYEMLNGMKVSETGSGYNGQNPYVDRDPRFYNTILYDGAPFKQRTIETFLPGGQDSPDGPESAWNSSETSYYVRKFIDESQSGATSGPDGSSSPTWIWYRYGEVLLNYAEAMYMLENEDMCREYINKIRSRPSVDMPLVTESGEALWDRLVNERRIELVFEEFRFFDVRRWKTATTVLSQDRYRMAVYRDPVTLEKTYTPTVLYPAKFNEWNYLCPIPQEAIDQNALIEQNPGY